MADDMGRQSINIALQMVEKAASMLATETNAVTNLLQSVAEYDNSAEKLLKYQDKHGKLEYNVCDKAYEKDFEEKLKHEEIVYFKMQNVQDPNVVIFVYPDCYKQQINDLRNDMFIQNGLVSVVSKDEMIRTYKGNGIESIDGLSQNQITIMKELLHGKNATISIGLSEEPGKYKMYFHMSNHDAIQKALLQQNILTNSKSESKVAEAITFDVQHKAKLYTHLRDNQEEHYYILGADNEIMEVKNIGFAYLGKETKYMINKNDQMHLEKAYATLSRMKRPVELTEEEFKRYRQMKPRERNQMYHDKIVHEKYPDHSYALAQEMAVLEQKTALLEKKIAMENPDRQISEYDLFNDSMNFTAFEMEEDRNMDFEEYKNLMDEKEILDIRENFEQYQLEPEDINFSQYQIIYEESGREINIPQFLREHEERDEMEEYRDEIENMELDE